MTRRTSLDRDYERLARHVCGTARGVCLGGGGARGLAHVGVLKVMEEARLPIDFISGASVIQGIYKLEGDVLTFCTAPPGVARPTRFESALDSRIILTIVKRRT